MPSNESTPWWTGKYCYITGQLYGVFPVRKVSREEHILQKKKVTLPCMQILIPHKLFCLRSNNLLYLLETHCNYKFQCKLLINKEIYLPSIPWGLFYLIKDIVKASTNIFYTHMDSLLNLAVFTSCFSTIHSVSCCLTTPLKWLHLSGW